MKTKGIIILYLLLIFGCKEEFMLNFNTNEEILVVEGGITNNAGPYSIRISTTLPLNQPLRVPLEDCVVTIVVDTGQRETLAETEPGVYKTSDTGIQGKIGNKYSLQVKTPDGKEYESEFEEMKYPVEIDSVYAELDVKEDLEYPYGLPGYQFYTNTKPAPDMESYILWKLTETYEYESDYRLYALYFYGDYFYTKTDSDRNQIIDIVKQDYDTLYTCWKTETVKDIFVGQTANLALPVIKRQPLQFVATDTKKLSVRYSLLMQQYTISRKAYDFWNGIQSQISDESFLNTKQPYNVAGNLKNVNDPGEITYGFFTVASIDQKRIYYNKPNTTFYYTKGYTGEPIDLNKKAQPVYLILKDNSMYFVHKDCLDCRTEGGTINKPDFWID